MRNFLHCRAQALAVLILAMSSLSLGQAAPRPGGRPQDTFSAAQARILPPPPSYHFPNGESYVFSVEWHLFTAGTATVSLSQSGQQEHVAAEAHSSGVVNALYKVNDRFEAFFDPRTFCSLHLNKHTEEGSRRRDTQVLFDYPRLKSVLDEKNLKTGEVKHEQNDIPACVTDVISGFYYLASLPLAPGNVHTFPINDGGKTTQVEAHVEAHEQVKVPAGTFQTVRVKAEAVSGPLKGKGTVWVWFTDDANRTPVQMRSKLGWGTLLFRLQRLQKQ